MEEFTATWIRPSVSTPPTGTRCLVTDGDVIVIATYISESTDKCIWMLTGLTETDSKTFDVQGWMPLPKPIKRIVSYEESNTEEVKRDDN